MPYYLKQLPDRVPSLLSWPPLRVYTNDTGAQWLTVTDLVYLEGTLNYTWLSWADGRRLLMSCTLKRVVAQLPPAYFLRLHRRYVVNRQFIRQIEFMDNQPMAYLVTGDCLPISRRRWVTLRQQLAS